MQDYKSFCRIIRHYESYLTPGALSKAFLILADIISKPEVSHVLIYQSAVCLKKILINNEESDLPIACMQTCISNIFQLLTIYKDNPNHLWNLLNLLAQITRSLSTEALAANLQVIFQNINEIIDIKDSKGMIVGAIAEMIEGILEIVDLSKISPPIFNFIFELSIKHLSFNLSKPPQNTCEEEDNLDSLFRLWLSLMKNYKHHFHNSQLTQMLQSLMSDHNERLKKLDPLRFLEITEEYLISGLVELNSRDVTHIFQPMISNTESEMSDKVTIALFSFYYTYSLVTNTYIEEVIVHALRILKGLILKISSAFNTQRSFVYMIICHHIIVFGGNSILTILGAGWTDYKDWFWPLVWSLDYLNQKYAR